jgi:tetratricopeptide (TPR) repeat protein
MRWTIILVLLILPGWIRPAAAGLYSTEPLQVKTAEGVQSIEPIEGPVSGPGGVGPLPHSQVAFQVNELLGALNPQPFGPDKSGEESRRQKYLERVQKLKEKQFGGTLTADERLNLGYYLVRLGQYEEAVGVLQPAVGRDCTDFRLLANLATAIHLASPTDPSRLPRAIDYQQQALDLSPAQWRQVAGDQADWLREVERRYLTLLRLRQREAIELARGQKPAVALDALFGPVRFVGDSGQYEAGQLAVEEQKKLPNNALAIVQQLVLWLPTDGRLYWLLGELYNAAGKPELIESAYQVFDNLVWGRNFSVPDLQEHRRIVEAARPRPTPPPPLLPPAASLFNNPVLLAVVGGAFAALVLALLWFQFRELFRGRGGSAASKGC